MAEISAVFFDIGGVLLTNGWDTSARRRAAVKFGLAWEEFEERHGLEVGALETGRLTLDDYLDSVVFHRVRSFTREEFRDFMYAQSSPHEDALALAASLAAERRWLLGAVNNESRELNEYRIETFDLGGIFDVFFSSCYLGVTKPGREIYRRALELTQRAPERCIFIDDRALNVEAAARVGMHAVRYRGASQLERELAALGVTAGAGGEPADGGTPPPTES